MDNGQDTLILASPTAYYNILSSCSLVFLFFSFFFLFSSICFAVTRQDINYSIFRVFILYLLYI